MAVCWLGRASHGFEEFSTPRDGGEAAGEGCIQQEVITKADSLSLADAADARSPVNAEASGPAYSVPAVDEAHPAIEITPADACVPTTADSGAAQVTEERSPGGSEVREHHTAAGSVTEPSERAGDRMHDLASESNPRMSCDESSSHLVEESPEPPPRSIESNASIDSVGGLPVRGVGKSFFGL